MDRKCLRYRDMMPGYIEDRLTENELEDLMLHLQQCEDCREELTTQYLISRGSSLLESDQPFDLNAEINALRNTRNRQMRSRKTFSLAALILEIGALVAFVLEVLLLIRL